MRIGIDSRALAVPPAGLEVYTRNLLRGFASLAPRHRYFLYSTKDFRLPCDGPFVKRLGTGIFARKGTVWMQMAIPRLCARDRIDLFWSPLQTLPVALPRSIPAVLTVHDFVQYYFPDSMRFSNWLILKALARPSWRRADTFITGSHHSKELIRKFMGAGREVRVVPHGHMSLPDPPPAVEARAWVRSAFGVPGPYILAVGTLEPRKNLGTLIRAVARLAGKGALDHTLVVAGRPGWKTGDLFKTVDKSGIASRVVFAGAVSDVDLARLYAGAELFVFPSLYEGFGIPVLEAMALGVPVVSSRSSSLPEVVGDAGVLFDPRDPDALADVLADLLSDEDLRSELVRKGRVQASRFSWEKAARETLQVFEQTMDRHAPLPKSKRRWNQMQAEAGHFNRMSRKFLRRARAEEYAVVEPTSWETSMVRDAFSFLGPPKGTAFLDYGCGHGHNAIFAAMSGAKIAVGFDIARDALRVAVKKARTNTVADKAFLVVAAAERLPFKGGTFNLVMGAGILHHVSIDRASLELRRILAMGEGRAAFAEPLGENPAAQVVRGTIGYPRKCRTPWERPLRRRDIQRFLRPFPGSEARGYYLLTSLQRAWRGYFPTGLLDRLDRKIMNAIPPLERFATQVLLMIRG